MRTTRAPIRWIGLLLSVLLGGLASGQPPPMSNSLIGGQFTYAAQKGDSLTSVGARFGIDVLALAELNGLKPTAWLKLGQVLRIENRHVVLRALDDGIVINVPQRMLFYFHSGELVAAYPTGLGKRTWPTPLGDFRVLEKERNKTWIVPESIQEEMLAKGEAVREKVPPGPDNPLGRHWIRISSSCGIHGTNAPASIYHFQTHGCIRLMPEDISRLFEEVPIGTPVKILYQPVLLARLPDGKLYLEAHRDTYRKAGDPLAAVKQIADAAGVGSMIDWQEVLKVIRKRRGLAVAVSLPTANVSQKESMKSLDRQKHPSRLQNISRREFVRLGSVATAAVAAPSLVFARMRAARPVERRLAFYNLHTGEHLNTIYWARGRYVPGALSKINWILRDYRRNAVKPIDVRLLDLLYALDGKLETHQPFHIICGYRTLATNEYLRLHTAGVAKHSLHMQAMAVDIRIPGCRLAAVQRAALALGDGGVGIYPLSDFIHVDVGRVRHWRFPPAARQARRS